MRPDQGMRCLRGALVSAVDIDIELVAFVGNIVTNSVMIAAAIAGPRFTPAIETSGTCLAFPKPR
jgi:hypothetical protein